MPAAARYEPSNQGILKGSITVPLTSCLTGLDLSVLDVKTKIVSCHTADSKSVKQEVNSTMIRFSLAALGAEIMALSRTPLLGAAWAQSYKRFVMVKPAPVNHLQGRLQTLPTNIRLGLKGLKRKNTLA